MLLKLFTWPKYSRTLGEQKGLGGVLSFVLRRSLEESPEFERMRSLASRQPFRELLRAFGGVQPVDEVHNHLTRGCSLARLR